MSDPSLVAPVALQGPPIWRETVEWQAGLVCHKGPWATAVQVDGSLYSCRLDHVAVDFAEDLEAGRWFLEVSAQLTPEWQETVQATVNAANAANTAAQQAVAATTDDREATGADRLATGADRIATGQHVIAAGQSETAAAASASIASAGAASSTAAADRAAASAAVAPTIAAADWGALSSIIGTVSGQLALSYEGGSATHSDPVSGAAVPNDGVFSWDVTGANANKWRYVGARTSLGFADVPTTIAGVSAVLAANPAGVKGALDARVGPASAITRDFSRDYYLFGKRVIFGQADSANRAGRAVTADGTVLGKLPVTAGQGLSINRSLSTGLYTFSYEPPGGVTVDGSRDYYYKGGRVVRARSDSAGRGSFVELGDGSIIIPKLVLPASIGITDGSAEDATYRYYSRASGSTHQVFCVNKTTGSIAKLTSTGNNWGPSVVDGKLLYTTDRFGATIQMYQPAGGGAEHLVNDAGTLLCVGDSLTGPTGGTSYPSQLTSTFGIPTIQFYFGGQNSEYILAQLLATVSGYNDHPAILQPGRNVYGGGFNADWLARNKAALTSMVNYFTSQNRRILIGDVLNGRGFASEYAGGSDYNVIMAYNTWVAATYPQYYVPIRAALVNAYNPSLPQDVADFGHDTVPTSLASDGIHLGTPGYGVVAATYYASMVTKGYLI